MAETVFDDSFEKEDLSLIAEDRGLKLEATDFFTAEGPEGVLGRREFSSAAFALGELEISDVVNLDGGYYILQLLEKMPEKIRELKDVEEMVKKDVIDGQSEDAAQKEAQKLLAQLKNDTEKTVTLEKLDKTTGLFNRFGAIPDIGNEDMVRDAAFLLSADKPLPEEPIKGANGYYVIRFKDRKIPDLSGFENQKSDIKENLLSRKQMGVFNALVTQLRDSSEISIKADFL